MTGVFGFFSVLGMAAVVILPIYFYIRNRIHNKVIEEVYELSQVLEDLKDEMAYYEDDTLFNNHEDAWESFKEFVPDCEKRMQAVIDDLEALNI
jgi:phosphoketolase